MRTEGLIRLVVCPVEVDLIRTRIAGNEIEVMEERRDQPNRAHDSRVDRSFSLILNAVEKRRKIPRIAQEDAVVADVSVLADSSGRRRIMEMINAALFQMREPEPPPVRLDSLRRLVAFRDGRHPMKSRPRLWKSPFASS